MTYSQAKQNVQKIPSEYPPTEVPVLNQSNSRSPHVSAVVAVFNFICRQLQIRFKAKQWRFPEYADNAYLICAREGKRKYGSFRAGRNISHLFESP